VTTTETDPLSLHLDQTTPQTVVNGVPIFNLGLTSNADITATSFTADAAIGRIYIKGYISDGAARVWSQFYIDDGDDFLHLNRESDKIHGFSVDMPLILSTLTDNGFLKTSGGDGTLSVDTNTYLTAETDPDFNAWLIATPPAYPADIGTWGALDYPTWASGTPFVKMTAAGTFALDTTTYLTADPYWNLATGTLTPKNNENITTTGTGTFGRLDIGSNYITSIKGSGPNDYVMSLIGLQGTSDSIFGQGVGLRGGKGYSILTTGNAGVGGGFGGGGGAGGDKTLTEYFSTTQQGGTGGSFSFYSGSGGLATTAVTNQKITGGQGGQTSVISGDGGESTSSGTGGEATGGLGGIFIFTLGDGGSAVGKSKVTGGNGGSLFAVSGYGGQAYDSEYYGAAQVTSGNSGNMNFAVGDAYDVSGYGVLKGGNSGYTTFEGGNGGNAIGSASGVVTAYSISNGGSGYSEWDYVLIENGGNYAFFIITGVDGSGTVTSIELDMSDSGFVVDTYNASNGSGTGLVIGVESVSGTATSATGGNGGDIKFQPGAKGTGSGSLNDTDGVDGDIIFYDSSSSEMMRILGDGTGIDVTGKLNINGGSDPDYLLLNKLTQQQFINRLQFEVPVPKMSGLALWWDGKQLYGFASEDGKTGDLYKIAMEKVDTITLPEYRGKTEKTYWFDKVTGEVKESSRNIPERYSFAKDYILDTRTGEFKKIIKTIIPKVKDEQGNVISPERIETTYIPATKEKAVKKIILSSKSTEGDIIEK
jgi:hypothetical protein